MRVVLYNSEFFWCKSMYIVGTLTIFLSFKRHYSQNFNNLRFQHIHISNTSEFDLAVVWVRLVAGREFIWNMTIQLCHYVYDLSKEATSVLLC